MRKRGSGTGVGGRGWKRCFVGGKEVEGERVCLSLEDERSGKVTMKKEWWKIGGLYY